MSCAYARTGQRDEAFRLLEENQAEGNATPVPSRRLEQIYACLGDRSRALEYLEKMYAERETSFERLGARATRSRSRVPPAGPRAAPSPRIDRTSARPTTSPRERRRDAEDSMRRRLRAGDRRTGHPRRRERQARGKRRRTPHGRPAALRSPDKASRHEEST